MAASTRVRVRVIRSLSHTYNVSRLWDLSSHEMSQPEITSQAAMVSRKTEIGCRLGLSPGNRVGFKKSTVMTLCLPYIAPLIPTTKPLPPKRWRTRSPIVIGLDIYSTVGVFDRVAGVASLATCRLVFSLITTQNAICPMISVVVDRSDRVIPGLVPTLREGDIMYGASSVHCYPCFILL